MNLNWDEHIKKGNIRKEIPNKGKINSLIWLSNDCIKLFSKISPDKQNSSILFTNYYEALREICEAIAILKGYKIYSHEAMALFIKEILGEEAIFSKFDRFRIMRNGVNYYGKPIPVEETTIAIKEIIEMISKLKIKYLSNV